MKITFIYNTDPDPIGGRVMQVTLDIGQGWEIDDQHVLEVANVLMPTEAVQALVGHPPKTYISQITVGDLQRIIELPGQSDQGQNVAP